MEGFLLWLKSNTLLWGFDPDSELGSRTPTCLRLPLLMLLSVSVSPVESDQVSLFSTLLR